MVAKARSWENYGTKYFLTMGYVTTEPVEDSEELADHSQLALHLGVTSNQLYMWKVRASRNGFPDPVAEKPGDTKKRGWDLWILADVLKWREGYVPQKGGRRRAGDGDSDGTEG